ncbi:DUF4253 domain-containing protein [Metasolibacillus sp.]|uniref:DUF4253 domain-containing protein n=1 Tax=Metasolibacillus sp. TaxID=2703680 RepID=UPI0025E66D69|nr:DUF4253 domain-containing protein [Metasolibacillus sp.]MCT6925786.1 DUF4253 domain-containing protein [Metasolibacillus sp.]MCT6941894.1 DUF4253 domain-containing protein [Metasolibacillus sp.]
MLEEMLGYLQGQPTKVMSATQWSEKEGVLIVPSYNLSEMLEEVYEEHESLSNFVQQQRQQMQHISMDDVWRKIAESNLFHLELELSKKSFEEIYQLSSSQTINESFLDEVQKESDVSSFIIDEQWIDERNEYEEGKVIVMAVPTEKAFEATLWMPMGGFNECPLPLYQAMVMKHWQEQYDAKPIAVTQDCWVLKAENKPTTFEAALALAKEHVLFCQYVLEAFSTIGEYADYLMKESVWYFWWD